MDICKHAFKSSLCTLFLVAVCEKKNVEKMNNMAVSWTSKKNINA